MRVLILIVLVFSLVGCNPQTYNPDSPDASGTPTLTETPTPAATSEVPKAFWRAKLGTSGGAGGGGDAISVWSDGSVFRLDMLNPSGLETKYLGQIPDSKVSELQNLLSAAENEAYQEYGNMTTSLVWQQEGVSRHDWAWKMGDTKTPDTLKAVEAMMSLENLAPQESEMPSFAWGDVSCTQGRIDFLIGQGQQSTLTFWCEDVALTADVKGPIGGLKELVGFKDIFVREHEGTLKITDVQGGWVFGNLDLDGKQGRFRLPAWVTVAP